MSADEALVEQVEACAAAAGRRVEVVSSLDDVRRGWRAADVVLVGADLAAAMACAGLPERGRVHLIGVDVESVAGWSVPLQASVLVLPEQSSTLSAVLTSGGNGADEAQVVRVVGGSGGVGASTLAVGLAIVAARRRLRTAIVELAPGGGGLDLVFGAENLPGWRWPDLMAASGHVGDLGGRLPQSCGVDIVSSGRDWVRPGPGAVQAVLGSLSRSHDLVVIDGGRGEDPSGSQYRRSSTVLVVGADVRGVLAARAVTELAALHDARVVVRQGRGRRLAVDEVASALGMPSVGRVTDDSAVQGASEAGDAPARSMRRGLGRDAARVLDRVLAPEVLGVPDVAAVPGSSSVQGPDAATTRWPGARSAGRSIRTLPVTMNALVADEGSDGRQTGSRPRLVPTPRRLA